MHQEKFDFFPLNRALSLSAMDEDSTESKVDDLLRQVNLLVERQREEVTYLFIYLSICLFIYLFIYLLTTTRCARSTCSSNDSERRLYFLSVYLFTYSFIEYCVFFEKRVTNVHATESRAVSIAMVQKVK